MIARVGAAADDAVDLFAVLDGKHFPEVKDGLFPVCVARMRPCREADRLVAVRKLNVKVGDERL